MQAATEAIRAAVEGFPDTGLAYVRAADTLALCRYVADKGRATDITDALLLGSAEAVRLNPDGWVFQQAGDLRELLLVAEM